jgi:hypothetical protein
MIDTDITLPAITLICDYSWPSMAIGFTSAVSTSGSTNLGLKILKKGREG